MKTIDRWSAGLSIAEHGRETRADARLAMAGDAHLLGHGLARWNPADPAALEIGERTAVARALSDVAQMLLESAAAELEDITHERARLHV
jgi:Domain of unknown function (DUF1876)